MTLSKVPASDALKSASPLLGAFIPLVIMISAAGTIVSFTLAAPRMYQSMAVEDLFFQGKTNVVGDLRICGASDRIESLLMVTKLITVFKHFKTLDEAVESYQQ